MTKQKVRKAVIPAAGFGTRFLPQTKAMPKEMLPIIDKPIIQYVVEALVEAGIEDIIIVSGYAKRSIEDHFDTPSEDLLANLRSGGESKAKLIERIEAIGNLANFVYVRQKGPYGNATPILNAAHIIGDEPFIYTWADDFVIAKQNEFQQMLKLYGELGTSLLTCVEATKDEDFERYGIVAGEQIRNRLLKVDTIIEKPGRQAAPSSMASVSSYLFTPKIVECVERLRLQVKDSEEFMMQPAIQMAIEENEPVHAFTIENGAYWDTGNKLDYLKTSVHFALQRKDLGEDFASYLRSLQL